MCIRVLFLGCMTSVMLFAQTLQTGAERTALYFPLLEGKRVGLVVNQTSLVHEKHLVDVLLKHHIDIVKIFAPEHGFRGLADAGETMADSRDARTGLPIHSLYGKQVKPSRAALKNIDIILFDIQDVGVRFYTYLSTLHYVMEAAAENHIPLIVLDRPNPHGSDIDGPVLEKKYRSFVGLDPVPLMYGMTIGEYAQMINGEGWLKNAQKATLTIIPLAHYTHQTVYTLPVKPSPNLPTQRAIGLYPSLALFEGTVISAGRGTPKPFECYGAPTYAVKKFSFIPRSRRGAKHPKYKNKRCYGVDLSHTNRHKFTLAYLRDAYVNYRGTKPFFKARFFDKLAGTDRLRKQIMGGMSENKIRKHWAKALHDFKIIRQKYLLYP